MTATKPTPELDDTIVAPAVSETGSASIAPLASSSERLAGRYELISLLGEGGMGTVYRARDLLLDELVALKVLRDDLSRDQAMLARFRQEVKLARKVTHANVARTFDIGEHAGRRFLTMELIDGVSLAESLRVSPHLAFPRVLEIANAICAGLAAAHDAGVVHRDLKPENVLLGKDGRVVITDFGIACATEHAATMKTEGSIGTPAYMAPEQVEGSRDIDARADLYALGAILFEMWTGVPAWTGGSVFVVAARRLTEAPPDPRRVRTELPDLAAEVTMRCMARARSDRYDRACDVAAALARWSTHEPLPSPASTLAATAASVKTVAVMPLRNVGSSEHDYLADGLTDDLVDVLSMTPGVRVCARGLVAARSSKVTDPRDVGLQLGVQVVVHGSVQRTHGRLRVNVRVLSVSDGFQLWAKRLDHAEDAFFEVSDLMARAVADALTCDAFAPPREAPSDPRALDLYLRARHEYHKYWTDNVVRSVGLFEQALALAPDDPTILAAYAMALAKRRGFDDGTEEHGQRSRRAADRALLLSPGLGMAKVARAYERLFARDTLAGARDLREVLEATPDSVDALELSGRLLAEAGALDEGIVRITRALELEPILASARVELARLYALRGDRVLSEAFFGEEPADPGLSNLFWINRARVALWQQDFERVGLWRSRMETRTDLFPSIRLLFLALTRDPGFAVQVQAALADMSAPSPFLRRSAFYALITAEFAQFLGETEMALTAIERADACLLIDVSWLDLCPTLEPLRSHPRFVEARARIAARAAEVRGALGV